MHTLYFVIIFAILWVIYWTARYRVQDQAAAVVWVDTDDNRRLALHHYPANAKAAQTRKHPVLLQHGLSANRFTWDMPNGFSLAKHLSAQGYDVWVSELRGSGMSTKPTLFGSSSLRVWDFEDYVGRDLPAIVAKVLAKTGATKLHWIGHSMGGILGYAYQQRHGAEQLASFAAIGSALDYRVGNSAFTKLLPARKFIEWLPTLPVGWFHRGLTPWAGRFGGATERFMYWPENMVSHIGRVLHANTFDNVSMDLMAQLATLMEPTGFRSSLDTHNYRQSLDQSTAPTLATAGDRDLQCPPDAVIWTVDNCGASEKKVIVYGRGLASARDSKTDVAVDWRACDEHYGHFDLIVGRNAATEVWPDLSNWLNKHDA